MNREKLRVEEVSVESRTEATGRRSEVGGQSSGIGHLSSGLPRLVAPKHCEGGSDFRVFTPTLKRFNSLIPKLWQKPSHLIPPNPGIKNKTHPFPSQSRMQVDRHPSLITVPADVSSFHSTVRKPIQTKSTKGGVRLPGPEFVPNRASSYPWFQAPICRADAAGTSVHTTDFWTGREMIVRGTEFIPLTSIPLPRVL
jgi:hypothetical protein